MGSKKQYNDYSYEGWAEAFTIFAKYQKNDPLAHVATEHDIIYAGCAPKLVSHEDQERLDELGWYPDDDLKCFFNLV